MKTTYKFVGVLTAVEPLTVALKDASTSSGPHRLPRNGGFKAKPYFPATSIRGALRNAAETGLVQKLSKEGKRLQLADHFALAQGVDIRGNAEEFNAGAIDATNKIRAENPFISLWGRWGITGKVNVGNMLPIPDECSANFGGGARGIMFKRNPTKLELLTPDEIDELNVILFEQNDVSERAKPLKGQIKNLEKAIRLAEGETKDKMKLEILALEKEIDDLKEAKSGPKESIQRPIDTYEAFVMGCTFEHRMTLAGATEHELALFLMALTEFAKNPHLGGHRAHNCGLVHGSYKVMAMQDGDEAFKEVGEIEWKDEGLVVTPKTESLATSRTMISNWVENFGQMNFTKW